ncbi:hypothetical protein D8674_000944 [Pyrus ussuriensis x Pyrus communis]|uniref:Agglutinin domain-containing protein n=1 Tax=Pyrus ussuriensis x Pyrus communis TaxID=2448454 RepID=A0A5N5FI17_9ROSA|nr:uncharacterized protein LOC125480193 [Pyrus x bretschneideri]KAB2598024.1 hypothetical protein D8674_000944 [Pyrus ussuriensis x Pyrus communis]
MSTLPRFVVLKSNYNDKYLRFNIDADEKLKRVMPAARYINFTGEEAWSDYTKFEVEKAKSNGNEGLVHIRCCCNNKYWVMPACGYTQIVAGADEPDEDKSRFSCTLFEPIYAYDDSLPVHDARSTNYIGLRFRHVHSGKYVALVQNNPNDKYWGFIYTYGESPSQKFMDVFMVIDWESLVPVELLPKHVAFKGRNGNYLSARLIDQQPHLLQFESNDIEDPSVGNEVFTNADGTVRIKSNSSGKFWRLSKDDWICADSDDSTDNDSDTLFWPIKVGDNVIALRSMRNNNFCKRFTISTITSSLNANAPTIDKEAYLEVEEVLPLWRDISGISLRLYRARIYNQHIVEMAVGEVVNRTKESYPVEVKLSYTQTTRSNWKYSSVSSILKLPGVKSSTNTAIPIIADDNKVKIGFTGTAQFGVTETVTSSQKEVVYKVVLQAMTRVKVKYVAAEASFDVPFSYTQRDTLMSGETITSNIDDGVYTGVNTFDFKFDNTEEKL